MANRGIVALLLALALLPASRAWSASIEKEEEKMASGDSNVTLSWNPITRATRYMLYIGRDPEMSQIFFTVETLQTAYVTPEIPPGQYYYRVVGFEGEREIGRTTLQRFVVGKPVTVTAPRAATHEPPPAPAIAGPKHLELFPAYGKVRLAWETIEGARGYRLRLWEEEKVKQDRRRNLEPFPRWETEVQDPWIEIRDAPYTSFMYLDSGLYRWDVAAIDQETGKLGDVATGYFTVSRQWFLRERETLIRAQTGFDPHVSYYQTSSNTGQTYALSSYSGRLDADIDLWLLRQWGANFGLGTQSFYVKAPSTFGATAASGTIFYTHANFDVLFRTYLSTVPWGWTLAFLMGLGLQEYPQVDLLGSTAEAMHVSRPKELGARLGFRVAKRWESPWEMQLSGTTLLQAFTLDGPTDSSRTLGAFNGEVAWRFFHHLSPHFALHFGLGAEYKEARYYAEPQVATSIVKIPAWYGLVGIQLRYFPESAENTPQWKRY